MMSGTQPKVATSDSVVLDFTGLFGGFTEPCKALSEDEPVNNSQGLKKGVESPQSGPEEQQANQLLIDFKRKEEVASSSRKVYAAYQDNIRMSDQLQGDILKGIKAGEDIYSLFLKAIKAISLMTSNELFYSQIEADTAAIYGVGLEYKPALQKELQDTQGRLQMLLEAEEAEQDADSKSRIESAVKAHSERIEELENKLKAIA